MSTPGGKHGSPLFRSPPGVDAIAQAADRTGGFGRPSAFMATWIGDARRANKKRGRMSPDIQPLCFPGMRAVSPCSKPDRRP